MLSRALPAARALKSIARVQPQVVRCMGGAAPAHWKSERQVAIDGKITLDDIPVPEGSWQEQQDRINKSQNVMLVGSLVFFAITAVAAYQFGAVYMHGEPPLKSVKFD
ncbi:hypothetical protein SNE40_020913 [Patella caerulea]|uniref:Deltamethrin resistance protein prag01 domain-containing protein n=1 Tax=Patella caerulea TaxID=87958 RepID=A0AAN8IYS1_PATCE